MQPGTHVDRYVVVERLGEGGMASVYLARHRILGSRHAVKVLRAELVARSSVRDRFLAEGRIAAQIRHPNVIDVTDVIIAPGVAGLVMEFVEGPTLESWIDDGHAPASVEQILTIALPVLDGLGEAHAYGVVHRDLKPANIILGSDRRGGMRPVVLDFGIAKLGADTRVEHATRRPTKDGTRMGTPAYMSPEQVRESARVDERTDVFAMGAILYELVTGHIAFAHDSEYDTMQAIVEGRYAPVSTHRSDVPPPLVAIIERALSTDPDRRFSSCGELSQALGDLMHVRPAPQATPAPSAPTKPVVPAKPVRRRPWHGTALLQDDVVHPLRNTSVSCGSSADCDIVLDHPSVSPLHCLFEQERGRWGVRDQRSTLGTLVSGQLALGRTLIKPGQTVTVGQVDLVFREG